jgi:hypothetical protein
MTISDATRRTIRTSLAAVLTIAVLVPVALHEAGITTDMLPRWAVGLLALLAAFTRIINTPAVEAFFRTFAPWLAVAQPPVIGGVDPTAPIVILPNDDQVSSNP